MLGFVPKQKLTLHHRMSFLLRTGLAGIVNNAGIGGSAAGLADWLVIQDYVDVMRVNLLGVIDVTTTFLPLLKKERGRIVNTSSVSGRLGGSFSAPYSVSKFGVEAFSDVIRYISSKSFRIYRVNIQFKR